MSSRAGSTRRSSPTAGSRPPLEALAARATLPVEVNGLPPERLAEPIEAAAFYVVSESLANVAKYAAATPGAGRPRPATTACSWSRSPTTASAGRTPARDPACAGLSDRVEALGGHLHVSSEQGRGTTVRAELPLLVAD